MTARRLPAVLGVALATCAVCVAIAQPVAQKPAIKVGDSWEFRRTADPEGKSTEWTRTIVELAPNDVVKVRMGDGKVSEYDSALNFMPDGLADHARILVKYPLKVGEEWEMSRKFPNPGIAEIGKARVVAFETITVPAGTFQCYRVEAEASLVSRTAKEDRSWKRWYCPDIRWIAKEVLETRTHGTRSRLGSASVETSELVKFTPGN